MEKSAATRIARALKEDLASYAYKISHHGASLHANKVTWLKAIQPKVSFASSGYNYANCKHPRCDTIDRLKALHTLDDAPRHDIYCGNRGDPTPLRNFDLHIYETSPASDVVCFLRYDANFNFEDKCYQVEQTSIANWD